jgi:hypothetical protein
LIETPLIHARAHKSLPSDVSLALNNIDVMSYLGIASDHSHALKAQKIAAYCKQFALEDLPNESEFDILIRSRAPLALAVVERKHLDAIKYFLRLFLYK